MKVNLFTNDSLVSTLVPFVGKVEMRISALLAHEVVTSTSLKRDEDTIELSDALIEGVCADIVQDIQQTRDFTAVAHRSLSSDAISEFIYLMVALADEMLISTLKNQLPRRFSGAVEHIVFGTRDAGEQVFLRIERLLARRSQLELNLACAYLLVLSLGFKGQYFQQEQNEVLVRYHCDLSALALCLRTDATSQQTLLAEIDDHAVKPSMSMHYKLLILWCVIGLTWLAAVIGMEISWKVRTAVVRQSISELYVPVMSMPLYGNDR